MNIADYRTMMNTYANNLNTVLTGECPQGMSLDDFKNNIVMGTNSLSQPAQSNLVSYAAPLLSYGNQFAALYNIPVYNDAQRYFLSSFSPCTIIQDGKLVENATPSGLSANAMWSCALTSFNTNSSGCNLNAILNDNTDINSLTNTSTTFLSNYTGVTGVLVMINDYYSCANYYNNCINPTMKPEFFDFVGDAHNQALAYTFSNVVSQNTNFTFNDLKNSDNYFLSNLYTYSDANSIDDSISTQSYITNIINQSTTSPLSSFIPNYSAQAKSYIDRLGNIVTVSFSGDDRATAQMKINQIISLDIEISQSNLSDQEKMALYMANSVGKSSLDYWSINQNSWDNIPTSTSKMPWWKRVKCDIGGFINGLGQYSLGQWTTLTADVLGTVGTSGTALFVGCVQIYNDLNPALNVAVHSSGYSFTLP